MQQYDDLLNDIFKFKPMQTLAKFLNKMQNLRIYILCKLRIKKFSLLKKKLNIYKQKYFEK